MAGKSRPFASAPLLLACRGGRGGSTCKVFCQETQMVTVSTQRAPPPHHNWGWKDVKCEMIPATFTLLRLQEQPAKADALTRLVFECTQVRF